MKKLVGILAVVALASLAPNVNASSRPLPPTVNGNGVSNGGGSKASPCSVNGLRAGGCGTHKAVPPGARRLPPVGK